MFPLFGPMRTSYLVSGVNCESSAFLQQLVVGFWKNLVHVLDFAKQQTKWLTKTQSSLTICNKAMDCDGQDVT